MLKHCRPDILARGHLSLLHRDHFNEKHSGSETLDFDKVSKSFPAWTVTRDFWERALKPEIAVDIPLFHESGRRLVHKYRVYQDPLPHPALREDNQVDLVGQPGHGYCQTHTSTDRDPIIGKSTGGSAK